MHQSTPEPPSSTAVQPPASSPPIPDSSSSQSSDEEPDEETHPKTPTRTERPLETPPAPKAPRRSTRVSKPVKRFGSDTELWNIQREGETQEEALDRAYQDYVELFASTFAPGEPTSYKKAIESPHVEQWQEAMDAELTAMEKLKVWEVVPRPQEVNVISSKWVYKLKRDASGEISRYKARIVARGFTQVFGTDYLETYAPVTRLETIRLLFALAVEKDWEIRQIDVTTAYLNGDLDEEIYMEPPEGYDIPEGHVLLLKKALYGLKQAGRQWYKRLREAVTKFDLKPLVNDPHTYVAHKVIDGVKRTLILPVYVDDLIPIGDKVLCDEFEKWIPNYFNVTIAGDASLILGIRVIRNRTADTPFLSLDQEVFAKDIVQRTGHDTGSPSSTPLSSQEKLTKFDGEPNPELSGGYRTIIGSLMYLMLGTRPDLAYAVGKLSRFASNPSTEHAVALVRVVTYVQGTTDLCLKYTRQNHDATGPEGYTDSDWAADVYDSRSIAGYVFMLGNAVFSWYSKKQGHVSASTSDAEYTALFRGAEQAFWLRQFYQQIGLPLETPLKLNCDNQSAIAIAKGQATHSKSKAIRIETHSVRDRIRRNEIEVEYTFKTHRDTLGLHKVTDVMALSHSLEDEVSYSTQYADAVDF